MKPTALLFLAAGLLLAADAPKEDVVKKELEKLQGTWKIASYETGGQVLPAEAVVGTFVIKGDKYTFKTDDQEEEGTLKLDPEKKPATIDLIITSGNDKGKTQVGIYKLEGDKWTICLAMPGNKDRPSKFATSDENDHLIFGLKRDK
jgi:uncharacterized protein (TIGR03067 family)